MVDSRTQAYRNLIKSLLSCPSGEEPEILNTNLDFVDVGLVKAINVEVAQLNAQGHLNDASWLQNILNPLVIKYLEPKLRAYSNPSRSDRINRLTHPHRAKIPPIAFRGTSQPRQMPNSARHLCYTELT
jgi:hypothetical protein